MKLNLQIFLLVSALIFFFAFQVIPSSSSQLSKAEKLLKDNETLVTQQQYELALENILTAKKIYIEHKKWKEAVNCYIEAAKVIDFFPNYEKKKEYVEAGWALITQHLSTSSPEAAEIIDQKGQVYYAFEELDSACLYLKQAETLYHNHQMWIAKGWVTYTLATVYFNKEDYNNSEKYFKATEKIATTHQLMEEFSIDLQEAFGVLYYEINGDFEKAILSMNKALEYRLAKPQKNAIDSLYISDYYHNLGRYYEQKENLSRALYYYKQSLSITEKLKSPHVAPTASLTNYGSILSQLKENKLAITTLKKAFQINSNQTNKKQKNKYDKNIYYELSICHARLEQFDSATYFINKSIGLTDNQTDIRLVLHSAFLSTLKNNPEEAINLLHPLLQDINSYSISKQLKTFHILANSYQLKGDYQTALQYYQKGIVTNCQGFEDTSIYILPKEIKTYNENSLLEDLKQKAITLKAMNTPQSLKAAFETNQFAIEWAEELRQNFAFEATKVNLNKNATELYQSAIEIAHQLYISTNNDIYLKEAFAITEKQKGILLLESLIDQKGKQHYNVPKNLLKREQRLKSDIAFYKQKMLEAEKYQEEEKYKRYDDYHTTFNLELSYLKDTLSNYYQNYFQTEYQTSIASVTDVQKNLLQPNQALIEYMATDSSFYVFMIEKDNQHFIKLPKGEKEIATLTKLQIALRSIETAQKSSQQIYQEFTILAHQGYQKILEPLLQKCASTTKELIIVPDDALNYLPFEALLSETATSENIDFLRLPYLLHQYQFHYGYSSTLLLENQRQQQILKGNDQILAYAPTYKNETAIALRSSMETLRNEVVQLENTSKEIKAISQFFDGDFDSTSTATKTNFQAEAKNYGILHLAMHGQPSLTEPNYAHLVFSNVGENKDNLLHHYEITALETQAQLAVLSACETGVGKYLEGEGVMSLGRAFMYAGVPSVVMSLWKMNDQSTSELMPLFYQYLKDGKRKDQALHQAKMDYLNNATALTAHPFYWAGFVGNGNAAPIKKSSGQSWFWWLGGSVLIIVLVSAWKKRKRIS